MMLYGRTAFSMLISLITSRVTLQMLGVVNYGISDAVGCVVGMFSVVSGSLSGSISRFITYELGHGDTEKLKRIFSTAINIQLAIGFIIVLLGETLGVWFLNTHMNIPADRMIAANWVLQFAIWSFFIGLTQVPYGACIVAHEKMDVFAWFSIIDSCLRLVIVYLLYISPYDKLITLSLLGFVVSLGMRIAQRIYCIKKFQECHYQFVLDMRLLKEMTGFA
jgi:O-antigen/teichoic acid export membrane protein